MNTLQDLLDFINYILNKEQTGNSLSPKMFNSIIPVAQMNLYGQLVKDYERTQTISNSLSRFFVPASLNIDANGDSILPTGYNRLSAGSIAGRPLKELTEKELSDRMIDGLLKPTTSFPALVLRGNNIHFEPYRSVTANINYLRYPTTPVYDFYVDPNYNIVYRSNGETAKTIINNSNKTILSEVNLTGVTLDNSDGYRLYYSLYYSTDNNTYTLYFYKDFNKTQQVAHLTSLTNYVSQGQVQSDNNSGITGTLTFSCTQYMTNINSNFVINSVSGINQYNTTDGNLYLEATKTQQQDTSGNVTGYLYEIYAYKDESKTYPVAYGSSSSGTNAVTLTSQNDSGITMSITLASYPASGQLIFDIEGDNQELNMVIVLPASLTVELDNWRYEDKVSIAGHALEMIGINLKDKTIIEYAQKFNQRSV